MQKRNWNELALKLVDRYDMKYTSDGFQNILSSYAKSFWGVGVLPTTFYADPFQITTNNLNLDISISEGIAFDDNGLMSDVNIPQVVSVVPDPLLDRWDLLVVRYKEVGSTLVPKPSDPISSIYLNLVDGFEVLIRQGVPSASPSYPSKQPGDVVLCGLQVPNAAPNSDTIFVDFSLRELCRVNFSSYPAFRQLVPSGVIDGVNAEFLLPSDPLNADSILVMINNRLVKKTDYSLINKVITFNPSNIPAPAQEVFVWYIEDTPSSSNPLMMSQETPNGLVDGINDTFVLAGKPATIESCFLFVDRLLIRKEEFTLLQESPNYKIKFQPSVIPQPGQEVYIVYFVNPAAVGVPAAPGGGGGGTALTPVGSIGSPVLVDPTGGITPSPEARQVIFAQSDGTGNTVTANPQIAAGTSVGQELVLVGTSNINNLLLSDGNGLSLNGPLNLNQNQAVSLIWNGIVWFEISRR